MSATKAIVSGYVQGVGFRWTVQKLADRLGVKGTVKNLPDGTVEIIAQGSEQLLDQFFSELEAAPGAGQIDHIARDPYSGSFSSFEIAF